MLGHAVHYLHGGRADGANPPQQVDDPLLVVGETVVIEFLPDGRIAGLPFLVLVQYPLQGGAAAQPVLPCLAPARPPAWCARPGLSFPLLLVGPQDSPLRINVLPVVAFQRVRLGGLEPDVQVQQFLAHLGPVVEVPVQGQAGELPQQVHSRSRCRYTGLWSTA